MKRLILLRHATSGWNQPGRSDSERLLDSEGESEAQEMGQRLAAEGFKPQLIVSSPATRAIITARLVAAQLNYDPASILEEETVYNASLETLLNVVRSFDDRFERIMLVGHNPGLSELGSYLSGHHGGLPPAGLYTIDFDLGSWDQLWLESGRLQRYDYPANR